MQQSIEPKTSPSIRSLSNVQLTERQSGLFVPTVQNAGFFDLHPTSDNVSYVRLEPRVSLDLRTFARFVLPSVTLRHVCFAK